MYLYRNKSVLKQMVRFLLEEMLVFRNHEKQNYSAKIMFLYYSCMFSFVSMLLAINKIISNFALH